MGLPLVADSQVDLSVLRLAPMMTNVASEGYAAQHHHTASTKIHQLPVYPVSDIPYYMELGLEFGEGTRTH